MWQQPLPHWEAGDDVIRQVRRAEYLKISASLPQGRSA
jgi:hypothetical protein